MALSNAACRQESLGARTDAGDVQDLGMARNSRDCGIDLFRTAARAWLDGLFLDWGDSAGLYAPHAVLRQQPYPSGALQGRRRRFKHECLVARPVPDNRLGRELARKPPFPCGLRATWLALVADGHRMVLHLDA